MLRELMLLTACCAAIPLSAERPLSPMAVVDGVGASTVILDRYDDPPPRQYTVLFIDTRSDILAPTQIGQAVDRMLGRTIARKPLPADFPVQFGGVREMFEAELRRQLRQPGANWNMSTGKPRHGDYYAVVKTSLASVIEQSPIAVAFRHHGYALRLDGIARVTESTAPQSGGRLPAHIDEMSVSAHREPR